MKRRQESIMDEGIINPIKRRCGEEIEKNQILLSVPLEILLLIISNDLSIINTLVRLTRYLSNRFNSTCFNSTVLNIWKENFNNGYKQDTKELVVKNLMDIPVDVYTPIMKMLLLPPSQSQFSQFDSPDYQQAVIAGGYILKHITKKEFKGTDIDILFSCDVRYNDAGLDIDNDINDYIESVLDTCFDRHNPKSPYFRKRFRLTHHYEGLKYVKSIRRFYIKEIGDIKKDEENIKIEIIFLSLPYGMTLIEYMDEHFDFSFCKCWFDGKTIGTNDLFDQIRRVGRINNNRKTHSGEYLEFNGVERVAKYKKRGFEFID